MLKKELERLEALVRQLDCTVIERDNDHTFLLSMVKESKDDHLKQKIYKALMEMNRRERLEWANFHRRLNFFLRKCREERFRHGHEEPPK